MTDTKQDYISNSVAIIGMSGRFPGAKNVVEFWNVLENAVETITHFTKEELLSADYEAAQNVTQDNYVRARAVLEDVEMFDADFFNFTAREAELTDPQQRIWLEVAYEALEKAGYARSNYDGLVGVYTGYMNNSYLMHNILKDRADVENFVRTRRADDYTAMILNSNMFIATKTAFKLGLTGPALNIGTACSTSLVSVVQAVQSLLALETDVCIAGGINISLPQTTGYFYQEGAILSKDGHCRPFDASASGTVPGSGCGAVVLKRLEEAIEDRDNILAIIRGAAINNDGAGKSGFTTPSANGQAECIALAQSIAEIAPESISYVETLGTATPLGDPIEVAGLTKAFGDCGGKRQFCGIGSVKGNVGHLDTAAGITGLIKTVLALQHRRIPPTLHFKEPNPNINFEDSPFYVVDELCDWENATPHPRRAGVSSFGVGGTNAHVILEEAPIFEATRLSREHQVLFLSGKNKTALSNNIRNLCEAFIENPELSVSDTAWTLMNRRQHFDERRFVVCDTNAASAVDALTSLEAPFSESGRKVPDTRTRAIVFCFPDQGDFRGVPRELLNIEPVFRDAVSECCHLAGKHVGDRLGQLFSLECDSANYADLVNDKVNAQLAVFSINYGLGKLWQSWGLEPSYLLGCGLGEWVAAAISGVVSVGDAIDAVWHRARMIRELVEAENTGTVEQSPSVEKDTKPFEMVLRRLSLSDPRIPIISPKTGKLLSDEEATSIEYWGTETHKYECLHEAFAYLRQIERPVTVIECGLGNTLTKCFQKEVEAPSPHFAIASLDGHDEVNSYKCLLIAVGRLWLNDVNIDTGKIFNNETRRIVDIPSYGFDRRRYWIDPPDASKTGAKTAAPSKTALGDIQTVLSEIWADVFGIPASSIAPTENFRAIGGDSLAAIRLMERIRHRFGVALPLDSLDSAPTIAEMSRLLESRADGTSVNAFASIVPVKIADSDGKWPILFVGHGSGGDVHWGYVNISKGFGDDQEILGLEAPKAQTFDSFSEMAQFYAQVMRAKQPRGPYYLTGFCFGGVLAHEIACQLRKMGEDIAFLGLIESTPINRGYEELVLSKQFLLGFVENLPFAVKGFLSEPVDRKRMVIGKRLRQLHGAAIRPFRNVFSNNTDTVDDTAPTVDELGNAIEDISEEGQDIMRRNFDLAQKHTTSNCDFPIEIFRTCQQPLFSPHDPSLGWDAVTSSGVTCHSVPGNHLTVINPPYSVELGRLLYERLRIAQRGNRNS